MFVCVFVLLHFKCISEQWVIAVRTRPTGGSLAVCWWREIGSWQIVVEAARPLWHGKRCICVVTSDEKHKNTFGFLGSVTSQKVKVQMDVSHLCSERNRFLRRPFFLPLPRGLWKCQDCAVTPRPRSLAWTRPDDCDQHKPCGTTATVSIYKRQEKTTYRLEMRSTRPPKQTGLQQHM